ncbi:hypothetical protein [Brevibacillus fortis]|uniref:hypothetical protein n=1 Tax=Brevibacillus fortis TaxID=2126352 RepID=UPI001304F38F|nr:hypothetical protein [Brevibacillus fortis]
MFRLNIAFLQTFFLIGLVTFWGSFKITHLSTVYKVGIEILEFPNHQKPENNFAYWKTGIFHLAVQDPNIEELSQKVATGAY